MSERDQRFCRPSLVMNMFSSFAPHARGCSHSHIMPPLTSSNEPQVQTGVGHTGDITAMCAYNTNLITGAANGELMLWGIDANNHLRTCMMPVRNYIVSDLHAASLMQGQDMRGDLFTIPATSSVRFFFTFPILISRDTGVGFQSPQENNFSADRLHHVHVLIARAHAFGCSRMHASNVHKESTDSRR